VVTIETTASLGSGSRSISGSGLGSGFIYAADGYILTAAHVIEGASAIKVTFADGRQFPATVVASDLATDVAVLHVVATGLPVISLGESAALAVGQTVLTIGDPLGAYPSSVTAGIISGLARTVTVPDELTGRPRTLTGMIQTDAAINSGNSGGPLLDASGAAIGLISATAAGSQNIGFATPIAAAQSVIANVHTT
jgi:S1-C subfamily serine protease